jgi:PAS domain S-box-containing protein
MVSLPLGHLARQADRAAGGDQAGTFSAGSGILELETLARTLNQMLQVIGEKQRDLMASGTHIKEQLAFRQTLIDTIAIPVFFKDREKRYLGCNRAFEEVFGFSRDELLGKRAEDVAPPELASRYNQADDELLSGASSQGQQRYESQVFDRHGRYRDVIFHKAVFRDALGQAAGVVGAYMDITDRKTAEKELERHREHLKEMVRERTVALEEANRQLAAEVSERREAERKVQESAERLAVLLREVNHRVKNNLSAIVSILHMEADEAKRVGDQGKLATLDQLERRVQGLSVVHSLLSSTRWQPLRLSSLCREIIQTSFAGLTGAPATYTVSDSPVLVGSSQAHHLALILNELVVNSLKHRLADTTRIAIDVRIEEDGEEVVLSYRDDGEGYPLAIIEGTAGGLGLELVKGIVGHSLRGSVTLWTEGGAVASLRFPAMKGNDGEIGL